MRTGVLPLECLRTCLIVAVLVSPSPPLAASIVRLGPCVNPHCNVPPPNSGFKGVATGNYHSMGLRSDGTLVAWGEFDEDEIQQPNRGYLAMTANRALGDALKSDASDATFSEAPSISTSGGQTAGAVAADIDGDGDQDIVAAEYGANLVALYENNGGAPPIWTKRIVDPFPLGPITIAAGDADGDGDMDVFSANFNEEGVAWYENNGASPPGWTKRLISGIPGAWGVHVADVDGDGDLDGIGGNRFDPGSHIGVEWYENNGAAPPGFTVRRVSAGFVDAASVHGADLDGDGDGDVLAVDVFQNTVYWFENDGAHPPAWTQRVVTSTTDDPWSVHAADLDRDGDMDVLSASSEDDRIAWYENAGGTPQSWLPHTITTSADLATAVFAADLDGDADLDVVSGGWSNEIAWYESDGGSPPAFTRRVIASNCNGTEGVFAARLDPDADVDILAACNILGKIEWYPNGANFAESDGDGVRDDIDCAPGSASAFAVPGAIRDASFDAPSVLSWTMEATRSGEGTRYDVLRGAPSELPVGSEGSEMCLLDEGSDETIVDSAEPALGSAYYYLVRGTNVCADGSYGLTSFLAERVSFICP